MKSNENYCLPSSYVRRTEYHHFDDTPFTDAYQDDVYKRAKELYDEHNLDTILDIGCGSGFKLLKYFKNRNFTGLEIEPTLSWLKSSYPDNEWELSDLSNVYHANYDLVICSDVIEHLIDPDILLDYINSLSFKFAVLSTPERNVIQIYQRGKLFNGPPVNPAHTMEWQFDELADYISQKFNIIEHEMCNSSVNEGKLCQYIIFGKNNE